MKMKKIMKKVLPILASGVIASTMAVSFMPMNSLAAYIPGACNACLVCGHDVRDHSDIYCASCLSGPCYGNPGGPYCTLVAGHDGVHSVHAHEFTYTPSGSKITATSTCHNETGCAFGGTEKVAELTLSASSPNYSGSAVSASFGSGEAAAWKTAVGSDAPTIKYYEKGKETDSGVLASAPSKAGEYVAKATYTNQAVTPNKDYTISVDFEIKDHNFTEATSTMTGITLDNNNMEFNEAETVVNGISGYKPQNGDIVAFGYDSGGAGYNAGYKVMIYGNNRWDYTGNTYNLHSFEDLKENVANREKVYIIGTVEKPHSWSYNASGATLTATCDKECGEKTAHTVTLTLSASSQNYSGSAVEASLSDTSAWEAAGFTAPTIVYEAKTGSELTEGKAVNVGSYTAKITAGGKTASVDFEITTKGSDAPKPQANSGASVINTSDLAGDIKKIENKFVAKAQVEVKIYLSASDFNKNKVDSTVNNLVEHDQRIKEHNDFNIFCTKMFGINVDSINELSFLQKITAVMFLGHELEFAQKTIS